MDWNEFSKRITRGESERWLPLEVQEGGTVKRQGIPPRTRLRRWGGGEPTEKSKELKKGAQPDFCVTEERGGGSK